MRKMKRVKRWTRVLLAGFTGFGACISGTVVTGITNEFTGYAEGGVAINATNFPDENF